MDLQTIIEKANVYEKFFTDGKSGLTSTSANHLANLAKQEYARAESELDSVRFTNKFIQVLNAQTGRVLLESGLTAEELKEIKGKLDHIANLKGFIAWLREAINAKDNLLSWFTVYTSFQKWIEEYHPEFIDEKPEKSKITSAINKMSEHDRAKYYMTEAIAATYGSFIHPNSSGDVAYKNMLKHIQNPREISVLGNDNIITEYAPSIDVEVVEDYLSQIRSQWRGFEASLNCVKAKLEEDDFNESSASSDAFKSALLAFNEKRAALMEEYDTYLAGIRKQIQSIKLNVPSVFQETYKHLQSLGKEK